MRSIFSHQIFSWPGKPSEKLRYSLVKGHPPVPLTWYLFTWDGRHCQRPPGWASWTRQCVQRHIQAHALHPGHCSAAYSPHQGCLRSPYGKNHIQDLKLWRTYKSLNIWTWMIEFCPSTKMRISSVIRRFTWWSTRGPPRRTCWWSGRAGTSRWRKPRRGQTAPTGMKSNNYFPNWEK